MEKYITGFNNGYLLAEYKPELLVKLLKDISGKTSDYFQGFFSGIEQFEFEKPKKQLNELEQLRNRPKNRERDLEKE